MYKQVLLGLKEMQQKGVIHRDIKNANLLVKIPDNMIPPPGSPGFKLVENI